MFEEKNWFDFKNIYSLLSEMSKFKKCQFESRSIWSSDKRDHCPW